MNVSTLNPPRCELNFHPLRDDARGYAFPCDESGHVSLDALSDQARDSYLYARALIGRMFHLPTIEAVEQVCKADWSVRTF